MKNQHQNLNLPNLLIFATALLLAACNSCKNKTQNPPLDTPEKVATHWQDCIDKNRFDEARQHSTGGALAYIAELASFSGEDTLEWESNVMLNLKCEIIGDSAHCTYHFKDELEEQEPGQLALKKVSGQWKVSRIDFEVDVPLDTSVQDELLFPGDTTELE